MRQASRSVGRLLLAAVFILWALPSKGQDIALLEEAFPNIDLEFPLSIRFPDDGNGLAYIAEMGGLVKAVQNDPGATEFTVILDLTERFATQPVGQLFGIALHPNYEQNGYVFARYKLEDPERSILSRFTRSADSAPVLDPASEVVLLELVTPGNSADHHAGDLAFGSDGYLYVPTGDGGTYLDQAGNAQSLSVLLGKVLRLDVDNPAAGLPYGIPADNPFVGNDQGWREEIFAYGFRNPWRLTIDRETGDVWLGDVGEQTWEEANYIQAGKNYGWPIMEGPVCAPWDEDGCDQSGLTPPVWSYTHEVGNSVVGGYVYRGSKIPVLRGKYVFLDFGTKLMWAIDRDAPSEAALVINHEFASTTFGEDLEGELYISQFFGGKVFKVVPGPGATDTAGGPFNAGPFKFSVYPQPSTGPVNFYFESEAGRLRLKVYDLLGREVAVLFDEDVGPGTKRTVTMDTSGLASGLYIARLEGRDEVESKRVVVVR